MAKKRSSKTTTQVSEKSPVEQVKPSSTPKKHGNEIDEIFAGRKRKKSEQKKPVKTNGDVSVKPKLMKKRKESKGAKDGIFVDKPSVPRRRTGDGLVIYTEEELGIDNADAGGTPLCPFDCNCCF